MVGKVTLPAAKNRKIYQRAQGRFRDRLANDRGFLNSFFTPAVFTYAVNPFPADVIAQAQANFRESMEKIQDMFKTPEQRERDEAARNFQQKQTDKALKMLGHHPHLVAIDEIHNRTDDDG